jgi:non-heme chloroperoxidase
MTPPDARRTLARPDGAVLSYEVRGTGTPVVLLHGFGTHLAVWAAVRDELVGEQVCLCALDLRGHGASTPMTEPTGINAFADDLAALLIELDLHDVVLVGHSLGGMVVQAFCAQHAELLPRVRGLLLVNTSGNPLASRATRAVGRYFQTRLPDVVHRSPRLSYGFAKMSFPSEVPGTTIQALASIAPPPLSSRRSFVIASVPDLTRGNARADVDVTVLASTKDLAVSVHDSATLAESFPWARMRLVRGTGHVLPLECPEVVVQELLALAGPRRNSFRPVGGRAGGGRAVSRSAAGP